MINYGLPVELCFLLHFVHVLAFRLDSNFDHYFLLKYREKSLQDCGNILIGVSTGTVYVMDTFPSGQRRQPPAHVDDAVLQRDYEYYYCGGHASKLLRSGAGAVARKP